MEDDYRSKVLKGPLAGFLGGGAPLSHPDQKKRDAKRKPARKSPPMPRPRLSKPQPLSKMSAAELVGLPVHPLFETETPMAPRELVLDGPWPMTLPVSQGPTLRTKIALAASLLPGVFTPEELAVMAWRCYPETFSLRGFDLPNSNAVLSKLSGVDGLKSTGAIAEAGERRLRLTAAGRSLCQRWPKPEPRPLP